MDQLRALLWLKFQLFLREQRGEGVLVGQALVWILGAVALLLTTLAAAGLWVALVMMAQRDISHLGVFTLNALILLVASSLYMMWLMTALLPTRGGGTFEPSNLLYYPVRLSQLFWMDVLSELVKGVTLLMLPIVVSLHLAIPWAVGRIGWGVPVLLVTVVIGALLVRGLEALVALANRRGRARGESLVALAGLAVVALILAATMIAPRVLIIIQQDQGWLADVLRVTPMVLLMRIEQAILQGNFSRYLMLLALLGAYLPLLLAACYGLWRRQVLATGGARSPGPPMPEARGRVWQLPGLSLELGALLEKELRYLARNSQVRLILAMSGMLLFLKFMVAMPGFDRPDEEVAALMEHFQAHATLSGGREVLVMSFYLLLFYAGCFNNMFGVDGAGMKAYFLAPVPSRYLLLGKNLAVGSLLTVQTAALLLLNEILFRDAGWEHLAVAACVLLCAVPALCGTGNLISIRFPKGSEFGRKLEVSPWGVLGMFVQVPLCLAPLVGAFVAAIWLDALWIKYVGMGLMVCLWWLLYWIVLLPRASRLLEARTEAVLQAIEGVQ